MNSLIIQIIINLICHIILLIQNSYFKLFHTKHSSYFPKSIILKNREETPILLCLIENPQHYQSQQGLTFNQTIFEFQLLKYLKPSQDVINVTQGFIEFNKYVLFILLGLAIISLIIGGLHIFWNLLDILQLISYLQFFNVIYPYNVETYFKLFDFAQFDFMKMFLNIEDLVNSYVISPDPHYKFALKGYSSTFYINAFAVFIAFVTTLSIYFICIIGSMILTKIMAYYSEENLYIDNEDPELFKFIILRIIRKVQRVFLNTIHYFCSGLLRTFMSVAYEYNLAIFLQLSVRTIKNPFLSSSFFISFIFLLLQLYFIIKGFFLMSNQPYYFGQQLVKQKYGALFEGVRIRGSRPYSNYYNLLLLCKKVVFIFVLVFCYSQAYITILTCSILNIIFIFYVKSSSPLKDVYEQQKVIGGELFIWFVELLILILFYKQQNDPNEQDELIIGWFIIVLCTLLVLYQCVLDFKQHFIFLKENYLIVQNLIQKIRNYFNKPIQVHQESQAFLHQTPPQYIQYDQRKIVTFRMEY